MAPATDYSIGNILTLFSLSVRHFNINRWVLYTYGLCSFYSGVFVLTFSLHCTQSLRMFFVVVFNSLPYYAFLGCIPLCFLNPGIRGLISFEQDLQVGVSDVELKSFDPQIEKVHMFVTLS